MKRRATTVAALIALQLAMLGGWWLVQRHRAEPPPTTPTSTAFESDGRPAPALRFERADGSAGELPTSGRVVVHFWATWCPPCRDELPALLRRFEGGDEALIAVSVDSSWGDVRGFLAGPIPPTVARADAAAAHRWGADALPATFVVEDGQVVGAARGALDWTAVELP
jgi:hypothetical protein